MSSSSSALSLSALPPLSMRSVGQGILLAACGWSAWKVLKYASIRLRARGKPLPHPPLHPIWQEHIDAVIVDLMRQHKYLGKLFMLKLLAVDFVIVCDPEACKEVMMGKNYPKSPTYDSLHPFIGHKSMLVAESHTWAKQRKAFTPGFAFQFLRSQVPVFAEKTELLSARLQKIADRGEVVAIHDAVTLLTVDVISQVALSTDFGCLRAEGEADQPQVLKAFMVLLHTTAMYASSPHLAWQRYLPWVWLTWRGQQAQFDGCLLSLIKQRLAESEAGSSGGKQGAQDILGLAIQTAKEDKGGALDVQDVLSQVKTFFFAGHDTTATTIAFAVYEVSRSPEAEARVLEEVDRVLGGRAPTADDLAQLKYLGAVVKEALRMWPPGGTARMAPPGATLQGYDIGQKVLYIPHFPVHRDPDLWGPDAETFKPERWLDEGAAAAIHPGQYMPFSRGPRDCIGQTFAVLEAKAVLAMLYQRFTFRYVGEKPEAQAYRITSYPKYHVPVTVHTRQKPGAAAAAAASAGLS